jgi:hypothetical protein
MKNLSLALFLLLFASSCHKAKLNEDVPNCIEDQIQEILCEDVYNPPAEVWKWVVDDKTYYYFTSDCCDQFDYLYDSNCSIVCSPGGGFTGEGDGTCPSFETEVKRSLVWKDDR